MCRAEILRALGDLKDPKAICNNVDVIILGDGKYPAFDWPSDYSTDGWLELAKETYPNVITYKYAGEQIAKRDKYLDIAAKEKCDYVLVWDTDEFIHYHKNLPRYPDWNLFYERLERLSKAFPEEYLFQMYSYIPTLEEWERAGNVMVENSYHAYVRLIKNPGEVRYAVNHYSMVKRDAQDHEWLPSWILVDGVRFSMDSKLRSPIYLKSRQKWAFDQYDQEQLRLYHYLQEHPEEYKQLLVQAKKK
jgi:hypothetical protein